jgi:hypothetical protein
MSSQDYSPHSNDSYARFYRLDEYPHQPAIINYPMSDEQRIEIQTIEALAASEMAQTRIMEAASAYESQQLAIALQDFLQHQASQISGDIEIHVTINR